MLHGALAKFAAGAAVALIGPAVLRPLIVGVIRAGYEARDRAVDAFEDARHEVSNIRAEAMAGRAAADDAEVRRLRAEAADLRAKLAARGE